MRKQLPTTNVLSPHTKTHFSKVLYCHNEEIRSKIKPNGIPFIHNETIEAREKDTI